MSTELSTTETAKLNHEELIITQAFLLQSLWEKGCQQH